MMLARVSSETSFFFFVFYNYLLCFTPFNYYIFIYCYFIIFIGFFLS